MTAQPLHETTLRDLEDHYRRSPRRLLMLDYDGTLVPFAARPELAKPDEALFALLEALGRDPRNELLLISGRVREGMDGWFAHLPMHLLAEHGVWHKPPRKPWRKTMNRPDGWKPRILAVLEAFAARTPGAFVEEKEYSVLWHCRSVEENVAAGRVRELKDALYDSLSGMSLRLLEGSKVVEVRDPAVNKGEAVRPWLSRPEYGFVLAVGDDVPDEDLFAALPAHGYSIKVRWEETRARYGVESVEEARRLLERLRRTSDSVD